MKQQATPVIEKVAGSELKQQATPVIEKVAGSELVVGRGLGV